MVARFEIGARSLAARGMETEIEDGAVLLRRVITADGRSRAYVNDRPATVGRLRELGSLLADLHGQHEQQNLLREDTHLGYLDAYADHESLLTRVRDDHAAYVAALAELDAFNTETQRNQEEKEFLLYQLQELDEAGLEPGEEEDLERERHLAAHGEKLAEAVGEAARLLGDGEDSVGTRLARAARLLGKGAGVDEGLEPHRRQLDEITVAAEETAGDLRRYLDALEFDPARLEELEARLHRLSGLRKKYGADENGLIARREELRARAEGWEDAPRVRGRLESAVTTAAEALMKSAGELSAARSRAAASFGRAVTRELRGLGMEGAVLSVELSAPRAGVRLPGRTAPVTGSGAEEAAFVLAANPGEKAGALAKAASGGEASRVMLALKNVLYKVDPVPLSIFDEVDAGIGGLVAEAVASRLSRIAKTHQVLVVTHLAVIAGKASHHVRLTKTTEGKRTRIEARPIEGREREAELARMLAGASGGEAARRTARSLLREGKSA